MNKQKAHILVIPILIPKKADITFILLSRTDTIVWNERILDLQMDDYMQKILGNCAQL